MKKPTKPAGSLSEIEKETLEKRKFAARDALDTISRAKGHLKDRELMRDVKRLAKDQAKHYTNIFK
jgi:hypothetical protein